MNKSIAKKTLKLGNKNCNIEVIKQEFDYIVMVDKDIYKRTANEIFAMQVFNAI